jgi:hypothetical protein
MIDSGYYNNADVSPALPATERLLFSSFYSFFTSSRSFIKEGSDLRSRSFDSRRLTVPDIDYTAFRYRLTDYHL